MIRQKEKRMLLKMVLIAAVFVMGVGINVAHAGPLGTSSAAAMMADFYEGASENNFASALYSGSSATLYNAYQYMSEAKTYAANAYTYAAGYASGTYAYYAYTYAIEAYNYFETAETYAYRAYLYRYADDIYIALIYGGAGNLYIAIAGYNAGIGSHGGIY